jgi:tRNA (adenine57-N1/adenine58-N1)-methyltransferase
MVILVGIQQKVEQMRMGARPIYPYDSGLICAMLNVRPGAKVLEAGTGSGGFTAYLGELGANVLSYEKNKQFYEIAKENLKGYRNVRVRLGDVSWVKEKNFDVLFLDLQWPDKMVTRLKNRVKKGGYIGIYTPIMDDIKPVWSVLEKNFINVRGVLLDHKEIQVKKYARIKGMLGFPGFFIWAETRQK